MSEPSITQEELKHYVTYDPLTGSVTWNNPTAKRLKKGDKAGNTNGGTPKLKLNGYNYPMARLAFLYVTGCYPARNMRIVYADTDRMNISWDNLKAIEFVAAEHEKPSTPRKVYQKRTVLSDVDKELIAEFRLIREEERVARWKARERTPEEMALVSKQNAIKQEQRKQHRAKVMRDTRARILANKQTNNGVNQ